MTIIITFPNGDKFELPASVVANERTKYYADVDGFTEGSKEWNDEYNISMRSSEIFDWMENNIDWEDIEPYAQKVENEPTDYNKMWFSANFDIKLNS